MTQPPVTAARPCRRVLPLIPALIPALLLSACATTGSHPPAAPVIVGIAAINDFHGNLEAPKQAVLVPDSTGQIGPVPVGGAAFLASAVDSVRARYPNHLTVSAGDMTGASPIVSSLFVDEPAIGVMNRIGLDFNAVGNHEFDSGIEELRRKQTGGCAQHTARKPCQVEQFRGGNFTYLAANVLMKDGKTLFPGSALRHFGSGRSRVTVGLIGMTLQGTGPLAPPDAVKDVTFADEADTANALVGQLKAQGADAIVLLIHQGGRTTGAPDPNGCTGLNSDIRPILDRLDTRVDVVVSGHTHWTYICEYGQYNPAKPFLLTSAGLWGEAVTDITLAIDPVSHRVVSRRARNVINQSDGYASPRGPVAVNPALPHFTARADVADYVARYVAAAEDYASRKVGSLAAGADKPTDEKQNTGGPLGALIADAQLAATTGAGAQIAFMNPFGVRRSLHPAADGSVTFGDIYAVQPFNNDLMTLSYTGAEIKAVLEQGFNADGPEQILTPSAGFAYSYDRSRPLGDRIVAMVLNGAPLDPAKTYRVTVSNFLVNGGDTYSVFIKGRDRVVGTTDIAALEAWLKAVPPRMPPQEERHSDARPDLNQIRSTAPPGVKYR